ncbi:hypothetical protein GCM10011322_27040 [Salinarimonas ramus]|uniref:Uncharacterized protein n=1 Tax=Salinarimonas ramus TaxID=690164 RepID=A0A917V510_9HYPH|nr:hypothetical protein GCM10011322_27040 [Salinarimonas ramus]
MSDGSASNRRIIASIPPAEAPIPTTGQAIDGALFGVVASGATASDVALSGGGAGGGASPYGRSSDDRRLPSCSSGPFVTWFIPPLTAVRSARGSSRAEPEVSHAHIGVRSHDTLKEV